MVPTYTVRKGKKKVDFPSLILTQKLGAAVGGDFMGLCLGHGESPGQGKGERSHTIGEVLSSESCSLCFPVHLQVINLSASNIWATQVLARRRCPSHHRITTPQPSDLQRSTRSQQPPSFTVTTKPVP